MSLLVAQVHCTYARYHRLLHSSVQSLLTYDFGTLKIRDVWKTENWLGFGFKNPNRPLF